MATQRQTLLTQFTPVQFKGADYTPQQADMKFLANSLAQQQARKDEANKNYANMNVELGKIEDLLHNDAETKEWFNNYKAEKLQPLMEEIDAGNYGNAINNAVKSAGEIFSDSRILGRIRSNKIYEEEKKKIDNDNNLDKLTKQRWADVNNYYYNDIYNDNGDVIGGDEWQASFNPVADVNLETLQSLAFQLTSEESKQTSSNDTKDVLVDKFGNEIDEEWGIGRNDEETRLLSDALFKQAAGVKTTLNKQGTYAYRKKDYDKLTRVWNRIIDEDPSRLTALKQKYDTYIWALNKADKRRNDSNLSEEERIRADKDYAIYKERLTDKNGFIYDTMDDWAKATIIPGFKDLAYNIKTSTSARTVNYNDAYLNNKQISEANKEVATYSVVEDTSVSGNKSTFASSWNPNNYKDISFSDFFPKTNNDTNDTNN